MDNKIERPESEMGENMSDWDSSKAKMFRLHGIKVGLIKAKVDHDLDLHWQLLDCYYQELLSIMTDKEKKDLAIEEHRTSTQKIYYMIMDSIRSRRNKIPLAYIIAFSDFEALLRRIDQGHGIDLKMKADQRWMMSQQS